MRHQKINGSPDDPREAAPLAAAQQLVRVWCVPAADVYDSRPWPAVAVTACERVRWHV